MSSQGKTTGAGVKEELSALLDDLVELASSAAGVSGEKLAELKQGLNARVEQFGTDAKDAAKGAATVIQDQAEEALDQVDRFAHAKPYHLAIAAGLIGLAIGVMVARK